MQTQVIEFLPLLLPVLVSRLGSDEVTEPSEELRLQLLQLLSAVVKACAAGMAPYLDDMILILQRTIVDPYPELKKVSGLVHKKIFCGLLFSMIDMHVHVHVYSVYTGGRGTFFQR